MATIKERKEDLLKKIEEHVNAYNKKVEEIETLASEREAEKLNAFACQERLKELEKLDENVIINEEVSS
tara:strand:- start:101 stop:307 length:207 start_codon:yes stop_codon:yes gene_type:complete